MSLSTSSLQFKQAGEHFESHKKLVDAAVKLQDSFEQLEKGYQRVPPQFLIEYGSVAAAVLCSDGSIFTGVCFDAPCGIGFCAEHTAIATALTNHHHDIVAVIAVDYQRILTPCGRCRELLYEVGGDNVRVLQNMSGEYSLIKELLPAHWATEHYKTEADVQERKRRRTRAGGAIVPREDPH